MRRKGCEPRLTPVVNPTLHTYHSTLRILCEAFQIDTDRHDFAATGLAGCSRASPIRRGGGLSNQVTVLSLTRLRFSL